jgi:CheY-like chemotaxis protein
MNCPKCKAAVTSAPDASGVIICAKCGARLRTRAVAEKAAAPEAVARTGSETAAVPAGARRVGSQTLPAVARPGAETVPPRKKTGAEAPADEDATDKVAALSSFPAKAKPETVPSPAVPVGLEFLFEELRAMRVVQDEILALLKNRLAPGEPASTEDDGPFSGPGEPVPLPSPVVRSRRRKTVLLIDDDPSSRIAALQALELAEVPTRTASDGNAGLAAIAQEKPDVIVLELGIDGTMSGKDVVNMVKATMEWVDVPIILYTRVPIESQKEARTIHGADELVQKGTDGANQLVARVIALFRKA